MDDTAVTVGQTTGRAARNACRPPSNRAFAPVVAAKSRGRVRLGAERVGVRCRRCLSSIKLSCLGQSGQVRGKFGEASVHYLGHPQGVSLRLRPPRLHGLCPGGVLWSVQAGGPTRNVWIENVVVRSEIPHMPSSMVRSRGSKMALGIPGVLLGWSSFLKNNVSKGAMAQLTKYRAKRSL